jgi:phosphinothricin acetyltransferase
MTDRHISIKGIYQGEGRCSDDDQSRCAAVRGISLAPTTSALESGIGRQGITVRDAMEEDFPTIQTIYALEVLHGLASFEKAPPSAAELRSRRENVLNLGLPYLAAELDSQVVGYSYATTYRPRPAYRDTVEDSVYVAEGMQGRGIGRALLTNLISRCETGPWRQMIAVIGNGGNVSSIALHERLGFRRVGTLEAVGFKLGRWVDTVLMQRALATGGNALPDCDRDADAGV